MRFFKNKNNMHQQDKALIRKLLDGDEAAFRIFYDTYFPRVYRFCLARLSDEEAVKDIVQQVMTRAMKSLANYRGEASLLTWLCQIARNELATWFAKHADKRSKTVSFDENPEAQSAYESLPSGLSGEGLSPVEDSLKAMVQMSLDSLPSAYALVLELKYIEGLSVSEIAHQMDTGEVATQSLLARARKSFKQVFADLQQQQLATNA